MSFKKIIGIHGVPRSGTSWLGQLFESSPNVRHKWQPLYSDSFKFRLNPQSTVNEFANYFQELYDYRDVYLDRDNYRSSGMYPQWKIRKDEPENLVIKQTSNHHFLRRWLNEIDNFYAVGIIRNPCAVLNSFRKSPSEFDPNWVFEEEYWFAPKKNLFKVENYFGLHKWMETTKMFIELKKISPKRFTIVSYENLVRNPTAELEKLFTFFNIQWTDQTREFISNSTSRNVEGIWSVYKGAKNPYDYENELDPKIIDHVNKLLEKSEFEKYLKSRV